MAVNPAPDDPVAVYAYLKDNWKDPDPPSKKPGVCALFAEDHTCLPGITLPPDGVVYIGVLRDHFGVPHSGSNTPRISLSVILKGAIGSDGDPARIRVVKVESQGPPLSV